MTINPSNSFLSSTSQEDANISSNQTNLQQTVQTLQSSLASGNLNTAQAAFQTLQKLFSSTTVSGSGLSNPNLVTDLAALGSALSTSDLFTARSAFNTLLSDMKDSQMNAAFAAAQSITLAEELMSTVNPSDNSSTNFSNSGSQGLNGSQSGLNVFA
jgi:hypothetical protein